MRDDCTKAGVLVQMRRLTVAYGKPFGQQADQQAEEYLAAFRRCGIPMTALERAVDESIDLGKRFPPISELIARAREHLPETDGQRQSQPSDICTVCGAAYFYAGYEFAEIPPRGLGGYERPGATLPKLRCACPNADPAWYTQPAMTWAESDPSVGFRKPTNYGRHWPYT